VQLAAARALGKMRDSEGRSVGVPRLIAVVKESQDDGLVAAAVGALGEAGDPAALDVLLSVAREGNPMRAVVAVEGIGRLDSPARIATLLGLLGHSETEVVKAALRAVSTHTDPLVEGHLARALEHTAWDVRRLAADILGQRGNTTTKRLLQDRLAVEEEPLVREAIQRSLAELDGGVTVRRTYPPPSGGESE
jgi:HEAT repeat protein